MAVESLTALETLFGGRAAFTAAALLLPLILTYAFTSLSAHWSRHIRGSGDPPSVPYTVPVVANTFQFAYDTEGFLSKTL
jgi:hypothetical protein